MHSGQPTDSFTGGAFPPGANKGKITGTLSLSPGGIRFSAGETSVELPLQGISVEAGGANDRLLFFRHAACPGWAIYTNDHKILKHRYIVHERRLTEQTSKIARKKRSALAILLLVLAIPVLFLALLVGSKKKIVEQIARRVPVAWEEKLGDTVFAQQKANKRVIEDQDLQKQFGEITATLLKAIPVNRYQFKFHIIEDPELNAFALPGGNVVVHTGLLLQADTAEEVAGVLAHEIAHVTRQHSIRNLIESVGLYAIVQAFVGDATGLLAVLANNAPFLLRQKFSRDYEREADQQGWEYLVEANIDPQGMISFFKKLKAEGERRRQLSPLGGVEESLDFLSTHPATAERIERLQEKLKRLPKQSGFREFALNFKEFQNSVRAQLSQKTPQEKKDK
jgi:predicted Zn-dependent protease